MGKMTKKVDSKEVGLEIGLIFFKHFLKTEYLHYGLFQDGLNADIANLAKAQQNYAEFLMNQIPLGTKSILDVGCGSGKFASELIKKGYTVDCVSPGTILTDHAKGILGDKVTIYQSKFENLHLDKKYDLILFSESFQYIPIDSSFYNSLRMLNPLGHIMICDFFQTEAEGKSPLGGGHKLTAFDAEVKNHKVRLVKEQDITKETAPTLDLVNALSLEVILPIYNLLFLLMEDRFPWVAKFIQWKYNKKLEKMKKKHFSGERNSKNFIKYKTYKFYLYQKS